MAKNQKKYTQEFKQQIVDLYNTGNYSFPQLSSEYGVAKSTILNWVRNLSPIQVSETETISMKEYKALQKKMRELEIENEILKKLRHIRKRSITEYVTFINNNLGTYTIKQM